MPKTPFHDWRHELQTLATAFLIVTLAPSLSAQAAVGTGDMIARSAGTPVDSGGSAPAVRALSADPSRPGTAESGDSAFHLRLAGNENFEIAGFSTGSIASAMITGSETVTDAQAADGETSAPQAGPSQPSLRDLGFAPDQTKGNAEEQARLDKRSHMLKIHQRLGLLTLVPMLATIITSGGASGRHGSASGRNLHGALGLLTAGLYFTSASYAIRAPGIPGTAIRGPIRLHKALAWIHGAGMILTPILGAMARAQLDRGERVHGIAAAHSAVADVTYAAYAAAIGTVAIKF